MAQPRWRVLHAMDYSRVFVDDTGVYDPEMEIVREINVAFGRDTMKTEPNK